VATNAKVLLKALNRSDVIIVHQELGLGRVDALYASREREILVEEQIPGSRQNSR